MIPSIYMYFSCYSLFLNKYTGKKITINLVKKIINYKNEYQILLYNSHWLNLIIFNKKNWISHINATYYTLYVQLQI